MLNKEDSYDHFERSQLVHASMMAILPYTYKGPKTSVVEPEPEPEP